MNTPYELTVAEWAEVAAARAIGANFWLGRKQDAGEWLRANAFGVRFDYKDLSRGYDGPVYMIKGAEAADGAALTLLRTARGLEIVETW